MTPHGDSPGVSTGRQDVAPSAVQASRDRRRHPRRRPEREEPLSLLRLRFGDQLTVHDISDAGALVEGGVRLLPGTHVDVHVITRQGRMLVRSRVIRARVCRVASDGLGYQSAIAFDRPVDAARPLP